MGCFTHSVEKVSSLFVCGIHLFPKVMFKSQIIHPMQMAVLSAAFHY